MADEGFAPTVPNTPDPWLWLHLSKPIEKPQPDESKATLIKGTSEIAGTLATEGEKVYHTYLENTVGAEFRKTQDQNISKMEGVVSSYQQPKQSNTSLMMDSSDQTKIPEDIRGLPDQLKRINTAKQEGTITHLQGEAELYKQLKRARSENPGAVPYIDRIAHEVTGRPIANSYEQALRSELSSIDAARKEHASKGESYFMSHMGEIANGGALYEYGRKTGNWDAIVPIAQKALYQDHLRKVRLQDLEMEDKTQGLASKKAEIAVGDMVHGLVEEHLNTVHLNPNDPSSPLLMQAIQDQASGKAHYSQTQMTQMSQIMEGNRAALEAEATRRVYQSQKTSKGDDIRFSDYLPPEKVKSAVSAAMQPYDVYKDALTKGDFALAHGAERLNKAAANDGLVELKGLPDIGDRVKVMQALREAAGPNFAELYMKTYPKALSPIEADTFNQFSTAMLGAEKDVRTGNVIATPKEVMTNSDPHASVVYKQKMVDLAKSFNDPKTPEAVAHNLANKTFDEQNQGYAAMFDRQSRFQVFSDLTSSPHLKKVIANDPGLRQKVQTWTMNEFNTLFNTEMHDVGNISLKGGMQLTWDSDNSQLALHTDKNFNLPSNTATPINPYRAHYHPEEDNVTIKNTQETVDRLNQGFKGLRNVYEHAGGMDPDTAVLSIVLGMGGDVSSVGSIPDSIKRAIIASHKQPEEEEAK